MVEWVLVSMLAYNFPSYFNTEQELNAAVIIDKSLDIGEDPYFMVALAWVESRVKAGKVSHTGDYGIFQINYRFWAKKWGYTSKQKFFVRLNQFNAWSLMEGELEDVRLLKEHFGYVFSKWVEYEQSKAKDKPEDDQVPF